MRPSGHIKLEADVIAFTAPDQEGWRVPLADIGVIGEFVNKSGRRDDDYFIVFMTREEWFKVPRSTQGCDTLLADLGRRLNCEFRCDLVNSTNFSSRVLWPAHLTGQPLYDLQPEARADNLITRLRQLLMQKVQMHFTDQVRKELGHTLS